MAPKRGRPRLPQREILPEFLQTVARAGTPHWALAAVSGWLHPTTLSAILQAGRVRVTPANVERLTRLANAVGYAGPLFSADEPEERP